MLLKGRRLPAVPQQRIAPGDGNEATAVKRVLSVGRRVSVKRKKRLVVNSRLSVCLVFLRACRTVLNRVLRNERRL